MLTLRERNTKTIQRIINTNADAVAFRESMKKHYGIDITDAKAFPVLESGFSWRALAQKLSLREADSSSSFTQFLRAGIQQITDAAYMAVKSTYEDWVTVIQSTKDTEIYAPMHGVAFPRQVGPSEPYPEVGAAALNLQLQNRKFGSMYVVEQELLNDDQTGSFQRQAGMLGEYLKLIAEVLCYGKLASVSNMRYLDYSIPTSETKPSGESNYPWSTGLIGGGKTRPSAYGALSQTTIQNGIIGLMNQKNLQGIKMQVNPNRLIMGPAKSFDASVLLNSAYYPSGAASAGNVGGAFAINPIKGIADLTISRFVAKNDGTFNGDSTAWYLVDDSKPFFVLQQREAVSVVQEAPNSGKSFELDQSRFKGSCRMNADFIDPRFAWIGSDGSA